MILRKKKKKEEEEEETEELEELLGEEEQVIPVEEKESPPASPEVQQAAPGPPPELDEIKVVLKEMQEKITRVTASLDNLRRDLDAIREDLSEKDEQIRKLAAIYDVVNQQINPFVEEGKEHKEELPEIPEIEEEEKPKEEIEEKKGKEEVLPTPPEEKGPRGLLRPQKPILDKIPNDFVSTTITLRWIAFLLERVDRKHLPLLLEYYKDIGWISDTAKRQLMAYARGVIQDLSYGEEELVAEFGGTTVSPESEAKRQTVDWRLPAEDHIKSLIFILRIKGEEIDKDLLNSIEMEIKKLRRSLEGYYGV